MNETETEKKEESAIQKEEVDPTLLEAALELLRSIGRGNGIKREDASFVSFEGEVLHFELFERFVIEPRVGEKLVCGKENGEVAGSQQDARNRVQGAITRAARNPDVRKNTIDILKKKPDLGIGHDDQYIGLDRLRQTFVVHELCNVCSGSMRNICQSCQGNGKTHCTKCRGEREIICPACLGRKFETTPRGQQNCFRCKGRGKIQCDMCKHMGFIQCKTCNATGQVSCKSCAGTGWHSHMTHLDMRAHSHFHYDREKFPPELPPLIDTLRSALVTEKHCEAVINEETVRARELDNASKPDEYFIPYNVRLPWGEIKFTLKGEEISAKLFGFQPSLVHAPPFLEVTAATGLRSLLEAAKHPGNVAGKIREAARTRCVAESVLAAAQLTPRRGLDYMHKKYPFGLKAETIREMLSHADTALKRVTKIPRIAGLFVGLAAAAALYALYYIGPGRAIMVSYLPTDAARGLADLGMGVAGALAALYSVKLCAAGALNKAIGKLLPPEKRGKLLPKAGQGALWAFAGCFISYFTILEYAVLQGAETPAWFAVILHLAGL